MKQINKKIRKLPYLLYAIFITTFLIGAVNLGVYYYDAYRSKQVIDELLDDVLIWEPLDDSEVTDKILVDSTDKHNDAHSDIAANEEQADAQSQDEKKPIVIPSRVNFEPLFAKNADVVAWLFCPDTPINYPVVQGSDNDTYLHSNIKLAPSKAGTLFVDASNSSDFSDYNTVIFGHNMKSGSMFHAITKYTSQSFYEQHPLMYLYTPTKRYKVHLLAGCLSDSDADIYISSDNLEMLNQEMDRICTNSTFHSDETWQDTDLLVTLSTCTYEYENARYVLIGKLVEW